MRISDWSSDVCSSDLGEATDNISARRIFRPSGAEEFAADGHFSEKLLHTNACSRGKCGRPLLHHLPIVDYSRPAITVRLPAFDAKARNAGNRWQRLSAKTQCNHIFNCIIGRSEEHTSELQSLMRISYAVFCLKKTIILSSLLLQKLNPNNKT